MIFRSALTTVAAVLNSLFIHLMFVIRFCLQLPKCVLPPWVATMGGGFGGTPPISAISGVSGFPSPPWESNLPAASRTRIFWRFRKEFIGVKRRILTPFLAGEFDSHMEDRKVLIALIALISETRAMAANPLPWQQKTVNQHNLRLWKKTTLCGVVMYLVS